MSTKRKITLEIVVEFHDETATKERLYRVADLVTSDFIMSLVSPDGVTQVSEIMDAAVFGKEWSGAPELDCEIVDFKGCMDDA